MNAKTTNSPKEIVSSADGDDDDDDVDEDEDGDEISFDSSTTTTSDVDSALSSSFNRSSGCLSQTSQSTMNNVMFSSSSTLMTMAVKIIINVNCFCCCQDTTMEFEEKK